MQKKLVILIVALFGLFYSNAQTYNLSYQEFNNLYKNGCYIDAVAVGHNYESEHIDKNDIEYAHFLDKLAECEYEMEYFDLCQKHIHNALKIKRKICGKNSIEYAISLHYLALCHNKINLTDDFSIEKQAYRIAEKHKSENLSAYYKILISYADYFDDTKCVSIIQDCLPGIDTLSIAYADALSVLANRYVYSDQFEEAIDYYWRAIKIRNAKEGALHPHLAFNIYHLANCYSFLGDYSFANELCNHAINVYRKSYGCNSGDYIYSLSDLGVYKALLNNIGNAIAISEEAMALAKQKYGDMSNEYAYVLSNYSKVEFYACNYRSSIEKQSKANEIFEKLEGGTSDDYIVGLMNLALSFYHLNDTTCSPLGKSLSLTKKHNSIVKKIYGTDNLLYANGLAFEARLLIDQGHCDEGFQKAKEAISIFERLNDFYPEFEASQWNTIARYYYICENNIDSTLMAETKALDLYEKLGVDDSHYISGLGVHAGLLCDAGRYDESLSYHEQYLELKRKWILNNFTNMAEDGRFIMWNDFATYELILEASHKMHKNKEKVQELAYNVALFNKGLLLNTEVIYRDLYKISADSSNHENVDLYSVYEKKRDSVKDSILYDCLNKEFSISWQDVQSFLKDNDLAIEFVSFNTADSLFYYALTLKKNHVCPKMIFLFSADKPTDFKTDSLYDSSIIYNLIWGKLGSELNEVNTIYFAPDGILNNIAIENAKLPTGQRMMDKYKIFRLSSTRELAKVNNNDHINGKIVLYGGLKYNASPIEISKANIQRTIHIDPDYNAERAQLEEDRDAISDLDGSKMEVQAIANLTPQFYNCFIYSDMYGTEESFKALSGTRPKVIHISTHGYYWSEKSWRMKPQSQIFFNQIMTEEDKALTRSGLYLAGVNTTLSGEEIPDNMEDGILTAQEISRLDLRGLDMVVLSACQTGLGDLNGDGVFGLQRGFKKAGAKSILMSLWKVNDYATQLLMVEFYKNYFAGVGKVQSLKNAQNHVKDYMDENGNKLFEDPYYWAGFVLLDGLDEF